ncbi:MAG: LacI family DNA-binding transcriptional regulator [Bifidobacterium sp.]|nr:LacI family DNA-binding transcriptional regulator [Bifidobacterium sp.]
MGEPGKRVTLRDVAREAGVSVKTASNVVNGSGRMTDDTRDRVESVIERLGYQINIAARNLNRDHTGVITLAVPTLTPPYLAELANRVIDAARQEDRLVYVTTYAEGTAQGMRYLLDHFNTTISDGMILSLGEVERFTLDELRVPYPLVCVGARHTGSVADHVTLDDVDAGSRAAAYLLDHGTKRLAVVGARGDLDEAALASALEGNAELRLRGILEECGRRGMPLDPRLVAQTGDDWTIGSGFRATHRLLEAGERFDGIVALNDQLAIGAMTALRAAQLDIPGDVQVIGFDDIEEAEYLAQPLTTMASRLDWMAPTAVERILARIEDPASKPELITADSYVIPRSTTRP